jgi:integrase
VGWWVWGSVTWIGEKMCVSEVFLGGGLWCTVQVLFTWSSFFFFFFSKCSHAPQAAFARVLPPSPQPLREDKTYLNLQEILRDAVYLLEALRVRVRACAREPRRHELLRLALALLLLLGLRLLRLLRWVGAGRLRGLFGAGVDALHFGRGCRGRALSLSERVLLLSG